MGVTAGGNGSTATAVQPGKNTNCCDNGCVVAATTQRDDCNGVTTVRDRNSIGGRGRREQGGQQGQSLQLVVTVVVPNLQALNDSPHRPISQSAMQAQPTLDAFLGVKRPAPGKENVPQPVTRPIIVHSDSDDGPMVHVAESEHRPKRSRCAMLDDEAEESELSDDFVVSDHESEGYESALDELRDTVAGLRNRRAFGNVTNSCLQCLRYRSAIASFLAQLAAALR